MSSKGPLDPNQDALNRYMAEQFNSELGSKAIVEHHAMPEDQEPYMAQLRDVLSDMAQDLQKVKVVSPGMEYLGSWSVHVFAIEALRAFEFASVTNPHKATHPVADAALQKLRQDMNEHFTGKRQKKRSGF